MQTAAKAYFQTQVQTTSQGKLLLMLYDGCIKFLNQAKDKIEERDYAKKGILISKALDVINELDSSLNVEKGGDLAENLHKLYFYCSTRLLNANLKMDVSYIDETITILNGLRSAYAQIIDTPEAQAAMAQTAPVQAGMTHVPQGTMRHSQPMQAPMFGATAQQPVPPVAPAAPAAPQAQAAPAAPQPAPAQATAPAQQPAAPAQDDAAAVSETPAAPAAAPQAPASSFSFANKRATGAAAMYKKIANHSAP